MRLALLLCVMLMTWWGCGSKDTPPSGEPASAGSAAADTTAGPRRGGTIVIGIQQEPELLNEMLSATAANNMICNLLFAKFVKYDDQLRLIPDMIEELPTRENGGISADYLTYRYRLRGDLRWHDGVPVTSRDVRFTYEIIMDPGVNVESREGWDVIDTIETPDDGEVIFHLKHSYPDFVGETFYDEAVLPEHILGDARGARFQVSPYHHAPVGSGPFRFKEWVSGSHLILERNDEYYGDGPYLDRIIFKFIPDMNTLLVQLKTGEIDFFDNAEIGFIDQLKGVPGIRVYKTPMLMYEHIDFNTENPILSDRRVRQALAYATNKRQIAEKVYNGVVEVAALDEFPASKFYSPEAAGKAVFDPDRARSLLEEAGWVDDDGDGIREKNGRELRLNISSTSGQINRERTEVVLKSQYREVGVDLGIRNYNSTVLYGTYEDGGILKRGQFDLAMYAWLSSPEPASKEAIYSGNNIPPRGQNNPRIDNARLTALLERGSNEADETARIAIYREIAGILVEEAPVVPLFWYTSIDACTDRLRNLRPNPTQSADTWNANQWYLSR